MRGTIATVHKGTPSIRNTDQPIDTEAVLLYPKTVAPAPRSRPKINALASTKRCQRWLKSGTRRRLLRLPGGECCLTALVGVDLLQDDHRDFASRLRPVVPEARVEVGMLLVK